jgi:peptide/nickel transport system permease protein
MPLPIRGYDMTEAPRTQFPDPESVPEPVPIVTERAALAEESPPKKNSPSALIASALLPGAGHVMLGSWSRGMSMLLGWGLLLGVLFWAHARVAQVFGDDGTLEDYVAFTVLVGTMLSIWFFAVYDLTAESRRSGEVRGDSQWAIASRHFKRNHLAIAGLILMIALYLMALLAPFLAPHDPITQPRDIVATSYLAPGARFWLGTDQFGRDVLSRILYGARISLSIGFIATAISVTLGTLLGAVAGYFGGRVDSLIMRLTDMVLAFPRLVLLIMIVALFSPSVTVIVLVLGLTQWPGTTRIVRGEVLSLREREYIQAARALGMGRGRIIFRHLIPNVLAPVIVTATLGIGNTIVLEAGLSFLGLGVQPPTPSWGNMVADGRQNLIGAWWVATFPGLAIVATVLAFNLVGDGLRDALDPRLRT